ncbi:MAG: hypothetical protein JRL30_22355 [Deltaproteobacteria bacterium]|nr:hypothetical protein [Deltaproteobacteria bacterium]
MKRRYLYYDRLSSCFGTNVPLFLVRDMGAHSGQPFQGIKKKASELLEIYEEEKDKRGLFQYHRLSKNNLEPAEESVKNAKNFLGAVGGILSRKRII